jgi:hypothetical protein
MGAMSENDGCDGWDGCLRPMGMTNVHDGWCDSLSRAVYELQGHQIEGSDPLRGFTYHPRGAEVPFGSTPSAGNSCTVHGQTNHLGEVGSARFTLKMLM